MVTAGWWDHEGVPPPARLPSAGGSPARSRDCGELAAWHGESGVVPGPQGSRRSEKLFLLKRGRRSGLFSDLRTSVTARRPCSATRAAVVSRIASRTSRRRLRLVVSSTLRHQPTHTLDTLETLLLD